MQWHVVFLKDIKKIDHVEGSRKFSIMFGQALNKKTRSASSFGNVLLGRKRTSSVTEENVMYFRLSGSSTCMEWVKAIREAQNDLLMPDMLTKKFDEEMKSLTNMYSESPLVMASDSDSDEDDFGKKNDENKPIDVTITEIEDKQTEKKAPKKLNIMKLNFNDHYEDDIVVPPSTNNNTTTTTDHKPAVAPPWAMKPLTRNMSVRMTPKARTKFKGSSLTRLNQYEVIKPLGEGATSVVYLCRYDASAVMSEDEIKCKVEEKKQLERKKRGAVADLRSFNTVVDVCDDDDEEEEEEDDDDEIILSPPPSSPSRSDRFRSGQMFALKVFNRTKMKNSIISWGGGGGGDVVTALDQVQSEVALMKKLRHDNLVRLYEVIDDEATDHMFLVLSYVDGGQAMEWNAEKCSYISTLGNGHDTLCESVRHVVSFSILFSFFFFFSSFTHLSNFLTRTHTHTHTHTSLDSLHNANTGCTNVRTRHALSNFLSSQSRYRSPRYQTRERTYQFKRSCCSC